ncbi:MAG: hypothetical protein ACO2Z9_06850, partial [Crocinitomicaceae bacterium]
MRNLLLLPFFSIFYFSLTAQSLVINEISQGSGGVQEYVEFVVIPDPSQTISCRDVLPCMDLRGWIFDDNNGHFTGGPGSGLGIAPGACRFSLDPFWACIPVGTIITIYNDADPNTSLPSDDLSMIDANCGLVIPISSVLFDRADNSINPLTPNTTSSNYPTEWASGGVWSQIGMANGDDSFQIYDPTDTSTPVHSVSWGNNNQNNNIYFSASMSGDVVYAENTVDCDFFLQANWVVGGTGPGPSDEQTPGAYNTTDNQNCIETLNNGCLDPMIASAISTDVDCDCDGTATVEDPLLG